MEVYLVAAVPLRLEATPALGIIQQRLTRVSANIYTLGNYRAHKFA